MNIQRHEKSAMQYIKRSPGFITIIDLLTLYSPIALLYLVLGTRGMAEEIFRRPEWSFTTVFIVVEILRDISRLGRSPKIPIEHIEGGIVMYAFMLAMSVVILSLDFANDLHEAKLLTKQVYMAKFAMFFWATGIFCYHRYNRHALVEKHEAA